MKSKRLAVTVLSILLISAVFLGPSVVLAEHPMPKNVGLSATALPDLSKLKLDPKGRVVTMGVLMRHVQDQEDNLVARVFSMPWEPEKNVVFEWRMAVPKTDEPASWEWKYYAGFEGSQAHERDKIKSDYKKDENGQLTTITVSILKNGQILETKTFVRPQPPADKK